MDAVLVIGFFAFAIVSWVIYSNKDKRRRERRDLQSEYPGLKVQDSLGIKINGEGFEKYVLVDLFTNPKQPNIRFYDTYSEAWAERAGMGDKESDLVSLPVEHEIGSLRGIVQGHLQRNGLELESYSARKG